MSLRVRYVNVQGLSCDKFTVCCWLMNTIYDFLFVAKTWFIDYHTQKHDCCFLALTFKLPYNWGRPGGGISFFETKHARSIISNLSITLYFITFIVTSVCVSGVYFSPTLITDATVAAYLVTFRGSSVVIGDINVCFWNALLQDGAVGLLWRLDLFTCWLSETG
jgi:hypothetical protein